MHRIVQASGAISRRAFWKHGNGARVSGILDGIDYDCVYFWLTVVCHCQMACLEARGELILLEALQEGLVFAKGSLQACGFDR